MPKIGGIISVYNEVDYLPYALKQAQEFCDVVYVAEGCHSHHHPTRSTDGTIEYLDSQGIDFESPENYDGWRYDEFQCGVWAMMIDKIRDCDWFRFWDVDMFWNDEDLKEIKKKMNTTEKDCLIFPERRFIFNWRFNTKDITGRFYRVTDGMYLTPISNLHHRCGDPYLMEAEFVNAECFHYTCAKKLERSMFRFDISEEKGTPNIPNLKRMYENFEWVHDEDAYAQAKRIEQLVGGSEFNIYDGEHPEVLKNHPYANCDDIRSAV
jgi:hypothetical protein